MYNPRMEPLVRDVRLALRRLRMTPGFTFFAVTSLAVGVGVSTAVYSAVRTLFWLPLGVPRQEELVVLTSDRITNISGPDFQDVRAHQSGFKALAASTRIRTALSSANGADVVLGEAVSGEYFAVMQLVALRGRLLTPLDERESSRVVVLSERFWRQHGRTDSRVPQEMRRRASGTRCVPDQLRQAAGCRVAGAVPGVHGGDRS